MPRNKEFDPDKLLDTAMYVFWEHGYHATSLSDIVEASGVQRYGIYSTFRNKRDLFIATMQHYQEFVLTQNLHPLTQEDASLPEVKRAVRLTASLMSGYEGTWGCYVFNTAAELTQKDPQIAEASENYRMMVIDLLREALLRGQAKGELAQSADIEQLTNYVLACLISIPNLKRVGVSPAIVEDFVNAALMNLK